MSIPWGGSEYLSALMCGDKRSHSALERLVDDLHSDKDQAVNTFLSHSGSEDFLWGLVKLVANGNSRFVNKKNNLSYMKCKSGAYLIDDCELFC